MRVLGCRFISIPSGCGSVQSVNKKSRKREVGGGRYGHMCVGGFGVFKERKISKLGNDKNYKA